jgi:hypothetical protein
MPRPCPSSMAALAMMIACLQAGTTRGPEEEREFHSRHRWRAGHHQRMKCVRRDRTAQAAPATPSVFPSPTSSRCFMASWAYPGGHYRQPLPPLFLQGGGQCLDLPCPLGHPTCLPLLILHLLLRRGHLLLHLGLEPRRGGDRVIRLKRIYNF